jgi:hypothetical protein
MKPFLRIAAIATTAVIVMAGSLSTAVTASQSVGVSVDGTPVALSQPPIEQGGRVFVPLRGVFERLGATVTYDNGTIDAVGNGRTVELKVGSTAAVVDGSLTTLDAAPFIMGSIVLVPLRFVSQALGAYVEYDPTTASVAITSGQPASAPVSQAGLARERPRADAVVAARRPTISAQFVQAVDPDSVRIRVDGRDVTPMAYVSQDSVVFTPSYDLRPDVHTVRISGKTAYPDETPFTDYWTFTSGASDAGNFISDVSPPSGSGIPSGTFTVSGTTVPNADVRIIAYGSAVQGSGYRQATGSYATEVTADSNGNFSQDISVNVDEGGVLGVRITSTAPGTDAGATVTLHYNT